MKKYWFALFTAASLGSASVSAQDLDYSYAQGGIALYPGFESQDLFGVDFQGKYALTPEVFLLGGLAYLTDDVDITAIHGGVAYRMPVASGTDLYGGLTVEYQKYEVSFNGFSSSVNDTALGLRGGIRHQLNPTVELGAQLRVLTGDLDYVGVRGSARYLLNQQMSLVGEVDIYDGELGLIGGLRFRF